MLKEKRKSKILSVYVVGIVISILFILALYVHVEGIRKFDTEALILLSLALIPWLAFFLDNATLPGGWKLQFRKLKEQQEEQGSVIEYLSYLFSNLLTEWEIRHLEKLNSNDKFPYDFNDNLKTELNRLLSIKFIKRHINKGIRTAEKDQGADSDLKRHFFITDKGKEYLKHLDSIKKFEEQSA